MSSPQFKLDGNTPTISWADPKNAPDPSAAAQVIEDQRKALFWIASTVLQPCALPVFCITIKRSLHRLCIIFLFRTSLYCRLASWFVVSIKFGFWIHWYATHLHSPRLYSNPSLFPSSVLLIHILLYKYNISYIEVNSDKERLNQYHHSAIPWLS